MRSSIEYADAQIESARLVTCSTGAMKGTNKVHLFGDIAWVELSDRRKMHKLRVYKMIDELAPCYLCNLCPSFVNERSRYSLRSGNDLCSP